MSDFRVQADIYNTLVLTDVINKENLKTIYGIDANLTISEDGKYPICMEYDLFRGTNEK